MTQVDNSREARQALAEIKAAQASGSPAKMNEACRFVRDDADAVAVSACKQMRLEVIAAMRTEIIRRRDAGEHDFGACVDLEEVAKRVSEEALADGNLLCEESRAAELARQARAEAEANRASATMEIPPQCHTAADALADLDTEWARGALAQLAAVCFGDLGTAVLAAEVPEMKYVCSPRVREVYTAAKRFKLDDAQLREWLDKARPLCEVAP